MNVYLNSNIIVSRAVFQSPEPAPVSCPSAHYTQEVFCKWGHGMVLSLQEILSFLLYGPNLSLKDGNAVTSCFTVEVLNTQGSNAYHSTQQLWPIQQILKADGWWLILWSTNWWQVKVTIGGNYYCASLNLNNVETFSCDEERLLSIISQLRAKSVLLQWGFDFVTELLKGQQINCSVTPQLTVLRVLLYCDTCNFA